MSIGRSRGDPHWPGVPRAPIAKSSRSPLPSLGLPHCPGLAPVATGRPPRSHRGPIRNVESRIDVRRPGRSWRPSCHLLPWRPSSIVATRALPWRYPGATLAPLVRPWRYLPPGRLPATGRHQGATCYQGATGRYLLPGRLPATGRYLPRGATCHQGALVDRGACSAREIHQGRPSCYRAPLFDRGALVLETFISQVFSQFRIRVSALDVRYRRNLHILQRMRPRVVDQHGH